MQLALELMQAQQRAADCEASLTAQKGSLSEAKASAQARLVSRLDAQLQAMFAAMDSSASGFREWSRGADVLLQQLANMLGGTTALPTGVLAQQHLSRCLQSASVCLQCGRAVHVLPKSCWRFSAPDTCAPLQQLHDT